MKSVKLWWLRRDWSAARCATVTGRYSAKCRSCGRGAGGEGYPSLAGVVTRAGAHRAFVPAEAIVTLGQREVVLGTTQLDLPDFVAREDETTLIAQVLDHQLVDLDGARVVRASDLYSAQIGQHLRFVGLDVGLETLLRRLGPATATVPRPLKVVATKCALPAADMWPLCSRRAGVVAWVRPWRRQCRTSTTRAEKSFRGCSYLRLPGRGSPPNSQSNQV